MAMWEQYNLAIAWSKRPSEMLAIYDPWVAYCVDSTVFTFGRTLENHLESINEKTEKATLRKRERELSKWLGVKQQYRNPTVASG